MLCLGDRERGQHLERQEKWPALSLQGQGFQAAEAGRDSAHGALCVSAALPQRANQRLQVKTQNGGGHLAERGSPKILVDNTAGTSEVWRLSCCEWQGLSGVDGLKPRASLRSRRCQTAWGGWSQYVFSASFRWKVFSCTPNYTKTHVVKTTHQMFCPPNSTDFCFVGHLDSWAFLSSRAPKAQ